MDKLIGHSPFDRAASVILPKQPTGLQAKPEVSSIRSSHKPSLKKASRAIRLSPRMPPGVPRR